jgi:hypothetical protein
MSQRDQIAKAMMFATANLIENKDEDRIPELTLQYWEAARAFDLEFADEPTIIAMAEKTIETFVQHLQSA